MSPAHAAEDAASRHRWAFIDERAGLWYVVCSQSDLMRSFEMPDLCHSQRDRTHYMPVDVGAVETSRMRHNTGAVVRSLSASGVTKDVVAVVKVSNVLQGQRSQASRVGNGSNVRESRRARLARAEEAGQPLPAHVMAIASQQKGSPAPHSQTSPALPLG